VEYQAEIHRIALSKNVEDRKKAVEELKYNFAILDNKEKAWNDLIHLTFDLNHVVRWGAADALSTSVSYVPDKKHAWNDLIRLTSNPDRTVRKEAASALSIAFSYVPDKKKAWDDLHKLIFDLDKGVCWDAASALGNAFSYVPDKKKAWHDLHQLTFDMGRGMRRVATHAIGNAFSYLPDKEQAWADLQRLTLDMDSGVRRDATSALGSAFSQVSDKKHTWEVLFRLTSDTDSDVKASAYHSLGKASIFKAANAEKDVEFKKEMDAAIGYFEKSLQQSTWSSPAKFCLPFYRSFYALTFKKEETGAEVLKYITEAKSAVAGSESKEKLLEAVENLGNALKEAQKARNFDDIKADLNAYRRYCERACELLDSTEEKAPGASRVIRKGLLIIDDRIKGIITEIQEKAKALCRKTRGSFIEEMG